MTEKKEHPNAMLLHWIADNKEIQLDYKCVWTSISHSDLIRSIACGTTYKNEYYRIKPKTIRIGKYDIAEPMKEEPEVATLYFCISSTLADHVCTAVWERDAYDLQALKSGMAWLKKEDATLAAKAIKELLTGQ